jgi:hypothetical protein
LEAAPPQISISFPVHAIAKVLRGGGAPLKLGAAQVSVVGS